MVLTVRESKTLKTTPYRGTTVIGRTRLFRKHGTTSRELSSIFILELTIDWLALEHWPILERRDIPAKGLSEGTSAVTYVKHD